MSGSAESHRSRLLAYTLTIALVMTQLVATPFAGATELPVQASADRETSSADRYAVIVAVEDYPGSGNDLAYTVDDALDFEDMLVSQGGFLEENILMLLDSAATVAGVDDAITTWLDTKETESSEVVFFYSGHGSNVADQVPLDEADGRDETLYLYDGNLLDDALEASLDSLESTSVAVFIDSCFSGGMVKSDSLATTASKAELPTDDYSGVLVDGITKDLNEPGRIVLTACDDDELSSETSSLENGVFTYYLLEGLASVSADLNANDWVSCEEAFAYLFPRVWPTWDATPQMYDGVSGERDMAYVEEPPPPSDDRIPGLGLPTSPVAGALDESTDTDDIFSVSLAEGDTLDVTLTGPAGTQFRPYLFPPGSTEATTDPWVATSDTGYPESFSYTVPSDSGGTYYLDVRAHSGSGAYTLAYEITHDGFTGPDDDIPGVTLPASPVAGSLDVAADMDDVFRVKLTEGQTLAASMTGAAGTNFDLYLLPPGSTSCSSDPSVAISRRDSYPESISYTVPSGKGGTYYLDLFCRSGAGAYSLTYKITGGDSSDSCISIAGADRYATAVEASKEAYPSGAGTVVIATGENWPDALGGAALAGAVDGPLLLTRPSALPDAVAGEISRLGAKNAYILGGTAAVTQAVQEALDARLSGSVTRIAGESRYATANKVADEVIRVRGTKFSGGAYVATGENFPDALGAAPLAAFSAAPILLVKPGGTPYLPAEVKTAVILGGQAAVTSVTETSVRSALGTSNVTRVGGVDRYDTAARVADYGVAHGMHWDGVGIATGMEFPDALSGGPMLGHGDSVLLLTKQTSLVSAARERISEHNDDIDAVYFIGGTAAVSQAVRDEVAEELR